ncbi:MAG TPA: hypothetical protein GXX14_02540 [Clostridiaceae bacterium]|nr:hypothetical protein [Clostridiaceae bacterium]
MEKDFHMIPVKDMKEARWIAESLEKPWSRSKNANYAAAVIPRGFAAYARIFHPAYLRNEDREVTWSEVVKHTGRMPHSQMQWHTIANFKNSDTNFNGLIEPYTGRLPERQAKALTEILCKYTNTPGNCYFAIWDGWNFPNMEKLRNHTVSFQLQDRNYYLMKGDIFAAVNDISSFSLHAPGIWWPEDRTWCVATEVDMMWTYVGGTECCIDEILMENRLEAFLATPDDRADVYGDEINTG